MEYKASLDTLAKTITIGVIILFVVIGYGRIIALLSAPANFTSVLIQSSVLLLFVVTILGSYLYAPRYYKVENNALMIARPISYKVIQLNDIADIRGLDGPETAGGIRTFGVGGLFGYYGKFYAPRIGNFTMYATQRRNHVLIKTKLGQSIVISPDDTGIVEKIKEKILLTP